MPKVSSKAQQRKFGALLGRGEITREQFDKHAQSGKAYKELPERKSPKSVAKKLKKAR